jgi:predicted HicB family RNase H-like nuclease
MKNVFIYKGFMGSVQYSADDEFFFGKIEGINDLVTFEGASVTALKKSFEEALEDYLVLCNENNVDPSKSFKGSFNIRINPNLHKQAFHAATTKGISLNQFVGNAIRHEIGEIQSAESF